MPNLGQPEQRTSQRILKATSTTEPALGTLSQLPGVWQNTVQFQGYGWNMIALPFPIGREHTLLISVNQTKALL